MASRHLPGYRALQLLSATGALACLAAAVGCSGQNSADAATAKRPAGMVSGTLMLEYSTTCTRGSLCAVLNIPGRGRLEIIGGSTVVASVVTGRSGGFRVRIPAGRYRFRLVAPVRHSCTADTPPAPQTFTVRPRRVSQLQVFCQAGRYGRRRSQ